MDKRITCRECFLEFTEGHGSGNYCSPTCAAIAEQRQERVYKEKAEFARDFGDLCKRYNIFGVSQMSYRKVDEEERVIVTFKGSGITTEVNVNWDSPQAMLQDIITHVKKEQ